VLADVTHPEEAPAEEDTKKKIKDEEAVGDLFDDEG